MNYLHKNNQSFALVVHMDNCVLNPTYLLWEQQHK